MTSNLALALAVNKAWELVHRALSPLERRCWARWSRSYERVVQLQHLEKVTRAAREAAN